MTSAADVRWSYKYYLGRQPEHQGIVDFYVNATEGQTDTLRGALFDSDEGKEHFRRLSPEGEFCIWRPDQPKVVIIGNCMGPNLGRTFAAMTGMSVYAFDILKVNVEDETVLSFIDDADYLFTPMFGAEFGQLSGGHIRARMGHRAAFYTLVYFSGVHPDITYIGSRGKRFTSPLGDYHSRTIVQSFLNGISSSDCRAQFNRIGDDARAIKAIYDESTAEYLRREADSDLRISDWLFQEVRRRPLLYTVNHPTVDVLAEICRRGCAWFGLPYRDVQSPLVSNDLSRDVIWPVHSAVSDVLGLDYRTPDVYWIDRYALDLNEFVWRSYRLYAEYDQSPFREMAAARGLVNTTPT